jgi:hypothetical protein
MMIGKNCRLGRTRHTNPVKIPRMHANPKGGLDPNELVSHPKRTRKKQKRVSVRI